MPPTQLSAELKKRYDSAPRGAKVVSMHLFAIEFAKELEGKNLKEICLEAEVPPTSHVELRTGMRLAEFVTLK